MGIVGGMRFHWPRSVQAMFVMFNIALFDIDVYTPTCGFPAWGGNHAFYLMLLLPVVYSGICWAWLFVGTDRAPEDWDGAGGGVSFLGARRGTASSPMSAATT